MVITRLSFILLSFLVGTAAFSSFVTPQNKGFSSQSALNSVQEADGHPDQGRRAAIRSGGRWLLTPLVSTLVSSPAMSDVSDGNALPQGAAQFQRVLRAKSDLVAVSKRVSEASSEMDKTEWNNVGQFLRQIYSVSEDMKGISNGFYEPEKKKKASELIDSLKKVSKAADASTGSQNGPEFLVYAKKMATILDDFLDLLRDVPDEL